MTRISMLLAATALPFACLAAPAMAEPTSNVSPAAAAEAEVERLRAQLREAEQAASAARALEVARAEAEAARAAAANANQRLAVAERAAQITPNNLTAAQMDLAASALRRQEITEADNKFGGVEFGAGISLSHNISSDNRIGSAQLVNGVIRVDDEEDTQARLLLEMHYFFKPKRTLFGLRHQMWGIGPFVALQPGEDDIIRAIGGGLMIGFRREENKPQSFNIGLGVVVDLNARELGEGLVANQPLPAGETEIRYRQRAQLGALAMVSFGF